jgi:hypothetical protein
MNVPCVENRIRLPACAWTKCGQCGSATSVFNETLYEKSFSLSVLSNSHAGRYCHAIAMKAVVMDHRSITGANVPGGTKAFRA